jgi:hypothetical protein
MRIGCSDFYTRISFVFFSPSLSLFSPVRYRLFWLWMDRKKTTDIGRWNWYQAWLTSLSLSLEISPVGKKVFILYQWHCKNKMVKWGGIVVYFGYSSLKGTKPFEMNGRLNIRCYFNAKNLPRKLVSTKFWKDQRI